MWSPEYEDERSEEFKRKCDTLGRTIDDLYEREKASQYNRINARVTEIR